MTWQDYIWRTITLNLMMRMSRTTLQGYLWYSNRNEIIKRKAVCHSILSACCVEVLVEAKALCIIFKECKHVEKSRQRIDVPHKGDSTL